MVLLAVEVYGALLDQGFTIRRYSRRLVRGFRKLKRKGSYISEWWLGPMPSRNRPGARCAITLACWAVVMGCRGQVGTMDVPRSMDSVCIGRHGQQGYGVCITARGGPGSFDAQLFEPLYLSDDFGRVLP